MPAKTLTVRGVAPAVLRGLRAAAEAHRRSLNGELLAILEQAVQSPRTPPAGRVREPAAVWTGAPAPPVPRIQDGVDREALGAVCRQRHICWLAVFGSRVAGTARPDSDVDVVVDFEPGMTPGFGIEAVAEALRPLFGGLDVDLVTRRGLRPPIRQRILQQAVVLHGA